MEGLARGVFVGRESQLERLRSAFDDAFAGRGSVVMLVGEPGIGKTRITQELETYARMRGARVLWDRAHEASGAPAYYPWKQIGDSHARFVPAAEVAAHMDPAQFRLFDAYTAFMRTGADRAPLLIVLDDLHLADQPSLLLLQHMARELGRIRVLIVGTYRDTDLSRTHPLSGTLAELIRESGFQRVVLRGLSDDEVGAYVAAVAGTEPSNELVGRIFEETEENPFFLSEVVNLMVQEGALDADSVSDIAIPDRVREAIGRRLNLLSEEANELLATAALVGRDFPFDTLRLLFDGADLELARLLDEGLAVRVVEELEGPGRYQFTHAQIQETLLGEISTPRRVLLNGRVAEALEKRYGEKADERASRLARHFYESATLTDGHAEKAIRYSDLAARQAAQQSAWAEATHHYEHCLTLLDAVARPDSGSEAELLLSLGTCYRNANGFRDVWRSLMRATNEFRDQGDAAGVARATLEAALVPAPPEQIKKLTLEALGFLGNGSPYLEAQLRVAIVSSQGDPRGAETRQGLNRARQLAQQHGFADVIAAVTYGEGLSAAYDGTFEEGSTLCRSAHVALDELGLVRQAADAALFRCTPLLAARHLNDGILQAERTASYGREHHLPWYEENGASYLAGMLLLKAKFDKFDVICEKNAGADSYVFNILKAARELVRDEPKLTEATLPSVKAAGGVPVMIGQVHGTRARVSLALGDNDQAMAEFSGAVGAMKALAPATR